MESRYKNIGYCAIMCILAVSCAKNRVPGKFPNEDEMAKLLVGIYQNEAMLNRTRISGVNETYGYYKYVLTKHNITKADFDSAMNWYTSHPKVLVEVYDKVIAILGQREVDLQGIIQAEEELKKVKENSIPKALWNSIDSVFISTNKENDSTDIRYPFNIMLDSLQGGTYNLTAEYIFIDTTSLREAEMVMFIQFADSTKDTAITKITTEEVVNQRNIKFKSPKDKYVISLSGLLLEHDTTLKAEVIIDNIELTHSKIEKDSLVVE